MKSHPGCKLLCTCWALFESLICLLIQHVSCCAPPGLYLNYWHAFMKFHPVCELLCISWVPIESLTCHHGIPSSMWVVVQLLGFIWITDISLWNSIQRVSCCGPSGLYLNDWHAFIKFYSGCELLCTSWGPFKSLTYLLEILSREWVVVHLLGSTWITDMPLWYPSSLWVVVYPQVSLASLTHLWKLIQGVSCCAPPGLYLNHWHALMKTYPASELVCTSWALFKSLTCFHEILSREWVVVDLLDSIWITDIYLWILIQHVSCCALPGLF